MSETYAVTSWAMEVRKTGTAWATWSRIGPGNLPGEKAKGGVPRQPEDRP